MEDRNRAMNRHRAPLWTRVRNRFDETVLCWETDPELNRCCNRLRFHLGPHRGRTDAALAAMARRRGWHKLVPGARD